MTVKHAPTVDRYAQQFAQMNAMLENLQEFVSTMPAPDERHFLPVDYGYTGDVARLHAMLKDASELTYEMTS